MSVVDSNNIALDNKPFTAPNIQRPFNHHTNDYSQIYVHKNDPKLISQGINVTTLKHVEGGYMPFLNDNAYAQNKANRVEYKYNAKTSHGTRPMHQTTFSNADVAYSRKDDFKTSNMNAYKGDQLHPQLRNPASHPDFFQHHFKLGTDNKLEFSTFYQNQFLAKSNDSFVELRKENRDNLLKNRKSNVQELIEVNKKDTSYWSQYKRIHDYFGQLRGPGVPREYPDRPSFNVFTGKSQTPSWSTNANNKRISGNVVLHNTRKSSNNILN